MNLDLLSNLSMLALVIGTIPSIWSVYKNRKNLEGFNLIGAMGIAIGQTGYLAFFMLLGNYITTILSIPLVIFWILVIGFKIRMKVK